MDSARLNAWTAIGTTSTAVIALALSLWQGCETRRHNRLSIRPALMIHEVLTADQADGQVGYFLVNCGLGPASISEFVIESTDGNGKVSGGALDRLKPLPIDFVRGEPEVGDVIQPGMRLPILTWPAGQTDQITLLAIVNQLRGLKVRLRYTDVYDTAFAAMFDMGGLSQP